MTKQDLHFDLVSMSQVVCRSRHGDNPTVEQVNQAITDVVDMINKPVYTVTVLQKLRVEAELYRRYRL